MSDTKRRGLTRVVGVVVLTLGAIYTVNLADMALANRRAVEVEDMLRDQVEREKAAIEAIETETGRAYTDGYVEEFARDDLKLVLPGDHPIVPIPVEATAPPVPAPSAETEERGLIDRIRSLIRPGS